MFKLKKISRIHERIFVVENQHIIPNEIYAEIFFHVKSNDLASGKEDLKSIRLGCKAWKNIIDSHKDLQLQPIPVIPKIRSTRINISNIAYHCKVCSSNVYSECRPSCGRTKLTVLAFVAIILMMIGLVGLIFGSMYLNISLQTKRNSISTVCTVISASLVPYPCYNDDNNKQYQCLQCSTTVSLLDSHGNTIYGAFDTGDNICLAIGSTFDCKYCEKCKNPDTRIYTREIPGYGAAGITLIVFSVIWIFCIPCCCRVCFS